MFPHTMTIYRHSIIDGQDHYTRQVISGVYWNEEQGIVTNGKGVSNSRSVTVITSKMLCDTFQTEWDIQSNDRIINGIGDDITSYKDISNGYVVSNVAINRCNSDVDNITIIGV